MEANFNLVSRVHYLDLTKINFVEAPLCAGTLSAT